MSWINCNYVKYPEKKMSLGHKKVSPEEADAIVERLYVVNSNCKSGQAEKTKDGRLRSKEEVEQLLDRLSDKDKNKEKTPDRNRTGSDKQMGIVNTYAWTHGHIMRNHLKTGDGNFY
ncbi:predicted protein [Nematostella vectensis]|uniref:Uncharacterized protein n=1 Tax=Nematostella vectensis TaxID=45351 RepID=A7RLT2_NEMVE|nr:predicted protein [Nematostella vectensis]|eukprot:XP_001639812.1 predicted protein [Nematostella vectensis]